MRIDVLTIFPDYLAPLKLSLVGKAISSGLVDLRVHDLRDWTHDRHRTVDDTPYGGGAGMVMRPEPWGEALDQLVPQQEGVVAPARLLVLTPSGRPFDQRFAEELTREQHLVVACGRYEGIDARVADHARTRMIVDEVSIGDYVLNGGEAAALAVIEAVVRLVPGVIGNPESLQEESHSTGQAGLLEYPVYTKPPVWRGLEVPTVLFSGHHAQVAAWRRKQALARTAEHRPELLPPETAPVLIGQAQDRDAGELWTLQRAAYLEEGRRHLSYDIPPLVESLDELRVAIHSGHFLVARIGARVVGSVRSELRHDVYYIGRLMVAPDLQRRGIGTALMTAIESLAPSTTTRFQLTTGGNSAFNLAFYDRRGYLEASRVSPPGEVPLLCLEKATDRLS